MKAPGNQKDNPRPKAGPTSSTNAGNRRARTSPLLGAHMSIAGGCYKAVMAACDAGCQTVQIFTKNTSQWRAKRLTKEDTTRFAAALQETGITVPTAHASYLLNLASPDAALWRRSLDALVVEIRRCGALGIPFLVVHPGSHMQSTAEQGLQRVVKAIDQACGRTGRLSVQVLLETTAGQGTNLGHRFEHLAEILESVRHSDRLGVCFDTCHAFAAGYAMGTQKEYRRTMRELNRIVGIERVKAFHLNDSKRECGSRIDRHEHIGRGELGLEAFRFLLNDRRFRGVPMYLETPKGQEQGVSLDVINLQKLRDLVRPT